jgi:farnesyl diphosphate synthase
VTTSLLLSQLDQAQRDVNTALDARLASTKAPERLVSAMRHAVFAGGKRIRPFLVMESARLFGVAGPAPLSVAAALECVHCYSLVHDDLPAMDNDDLRRGQPTVHIAFDEATAILAGDALLTLAFEWLADRSSGLSAAKALKLSGELARAAGMAGMVGGQMLDLAAEARFAAPGTRMKPLGLAAIRQLQAMKTGALISFATSAGAFLAPRATAAERRALRLYGDCLGLAFQIRDDLLDVEGDAATVGKAVAKDAHAGKATFVGLLGVDGAKQRLNETGEKAKTALMAAFGERSITLNALIDYNTGRDK